MNGEYIKDFNKIFTELGLFSDCSQDVVMQRIIELENKFPYDELIEIYNELLLTCKTPEIIIQTIKYCDNYKNPVTLRILLDILLMRGVFMTNSKEEFLNVRTISAKAISNYKEQDTVTSLLYCLNNKDENYKLRLACADALGKIGDKYAVTPLMNIVEDDDEKSVYVKESAVFALGMIGDIRAADMFVSVLEAKKGFIDKFTFLKERIIEALGKMNLKSEKVFMALKKTLMDESPQIRINAIETLMNSEYEDAYSLIKECLTDRDDEVKKNALIALYNMVGRSILDEVLMSLEYKQYLKEQAEEIIKEYEENDD